MKRKLILIVFFVACLFPLKLQQYNRRNIAMIGDATAEFGAKTIQGILDFPNDYGDRWKILICHPGDSKTVGSSEILQPANIENEFTTHGMNQALISNDFIQSYNKWINDLELLKNANFEPVKIDLLLVADYHFVTSKKYGMMHKSISTTQSLRGVFYINPDNKIAAIVYNPINVGRNLNNVKSTLLAF